MSDSDSIKPIPGYEGYFASSGGEIWSMHSRGRTSRQLAQGPPYRVPQSVCDGYKRVNLYQSGRRAYMRVHRLVLLAFVGPAPDGHEAMHLDNDKGNNRLDNLKWGTPSENVAQRERDGRGHRPAQYRILSDADVITIKRRLANGDSIRGIARHFRVSQSSIRAIRTGRSYAYL